MALNGDESKKRLSIAFIGSKGVGKTSLIKQFVGNQFSETTTSTISAQRYSTSVVTNTRIIEIHISDFPAIAAFPKDSLQEWNIQCQRLKSETTNSTQPPQSFCRLRQASAYVLVFDASRPSSSFQYIKQMRDQILCHGGNDACDKRPIIVAANKQDLVIQQRKLAVSDYYDTHRRRTGDQYNSSNSKHTSGLPSTEWSSLVRKQWRCLYVETSAKFNWQVVHLFQQVLSAIETSSTHGHGRLSGDHFRLQHQIINLPHILQLATLSAVAPIPPPTAPCQKPLLSLAPSIPMPDTDFGQQHVTASSTFRSRSRPVQQCPLC